MVLPNNYFQNVSKPHPVEDYELDEMVNGVNDNLSKITNVSTGHNHNGTNSRKITQVVNINLGRSLVSGQAHTIKFYNPFITPTEVKYSIYLTQRAGYAAQTSSEPLTTDSKGYTGQSTGEKSAVSTTGGSGLNSGYEDPSHTHTVPIGSLTHSSGSHTHTIDVAGGAVGDPALYWDQDTNTLRIFGAAPPGDLSVPASSVPIDAHAIGTPTSDSTSINHRHTIVHEHTVPAHTHTIPDTQHTHSITSHDHDLTSALVGSTFTTNVLNIDGNALSVGENQTPGSPTWFGTGAHIINVTPDDDMDIQIDVWIKGTI